MTRRFQILNMVALVVTIGINYLSNTGIFNNETMATISAKYQNLFTPAGYAFSIWALIYLGLLGFVIYFGPFTKNTDAKEKTVLNVGWWFVISCIANSLWVLTWLYEYTFLSIPIMVLLFISLLKIIGNNRGLIESKDFKTGIFLRLPFYIYSGWISVALIADVAAYLKKIQWSGFGISEASWTLVMFAVATIIHLYMVWKMNMSAFALVAVWALIAIAVANQDSNQTVYIAAIITAIFIFVNVCFQMFKKRTAPLN
ncbi:tryptophan-rich sensory protein [Chryseobacterium luquanense]|uniref:Tryptophan-rich sensory protein n=1 Tax=Chryseobacterium luquanense TaxID=2983766 RepID=A0ABT3XY09_9FLAO|nr:tryptophan-rich sensory protein [Chryseobacterium luquanense]MCX8530775.1 tryptophan-rich sensory protein [Chryseobacterium luquanense]